MPIELRPLLTAILASMPMVLGAAGPSSAQPPLMTPLEEYARLNGTEDKQSLRFLLNRCTSLYIFTASVTKQSNPALYDRYEEEGARFLKAAKASTDQPEVMLVQLQRMSKAYHVRAAAAVGNGDPMADPFIAAEVGFCTRFLPKGTS